MFTRGRTSRAQARRDREWRRFVRDLTTATRQLSPAEDERMRAFLDAQDPEQRTARRRPEPPAAERAA